MSPLARTGHRPGAPSVLAALAARVAFATLVAALLLAASPRTVAAESVAGAEPLGRLFLTPAERRDLDRRRPRAGARADEGWPRDLLPARAVPRRRVVLNGVVRRGAGEPVAWINGRQAPAGAVSLPGAKNRVAVTAARGARLKPGQAWDPVTGQVSECVGCGSGAAPAAPVPAGTPEASPAAPDAVPAPAEAAPGPGSAPGVAALPAAPVAVTAAAQVAAQALP